MRRTMLLVAAMATLIAAVAVPAIARPRAQAPGGEHKVTICHATASLTNPYVVITIDAAAWNNPEFNGPKHGVNLHAREKDGYTWTDVFLGVGEIDATPEDCPDPTPPPTTTTTVPPSTTTTTVPPTTTTTTVPPTTTTTTTMPPVPRPFVCAGTEFQYGASFPGVQLWEGHVHDHGFHNGVLEVSALSFGTIPAGTYNITLSSWDSSHVGGDDENQRHEQWAAKFGGTVLSPLSGDLASNRGATPADAQSWLVGPVTISEISSISAVHRSVVEGDDGELDSVIPLCVGLDPVEETGA